MSIIGKFLKIAGKDPNGNVKGVAVTENGEVKVQQYGSIVSINSDGSIASEQVREYRGLSADTKPTSNIPLYSTFIEMDTQNIYYWNGTNWQVMD